jgi:N-acetyltransferase
MEPIELNGNLVAIEPLRAIHAAGPLSAADADRAADHRLPLAILAAENGSVIGSTSYWDFDAGNAHVEIGSTWLRRSRWRTGCNSEAKLLLLTHAFETLELERVAFRTDIRNERSHAPLKDWERPRRAYTAMRCDDGTVVGGTAFTARSCAQSGRVPKDALSSNSI